MTIKKNIALILMAVSCTISYQVLAMTQAPGTSGGANQSQNGRQIGKIEAIQPGYSITIDGVTYVFSTTLAKIHDATGHTTSGASLTPGVIVSFLIKNDGAQQRITEIWVNKK